MSRAAVRAAVAAWFASPPIPKLNAVYGDPAKFVDQQRLFNDSSGSGAIGIVHIERQEERRIAIGGATSGVKQRTYDVGLQIIFESVKPHGEDASADLDALLDAVVTRLQSDRTLGGAVFQAGEGDVTGTPDVEILSDLPRTVGGSTVQIWNVVRFKAVEMLQT